MGVRTAQGVWRSCVWNAVTVSALTQASGREFHSGTVLTKNECLYWAVCDWMCLNLKLWWLLVLGSAGSKTASASTGMVHLTILKSMASWISRLRSLRGAQFRSFSNDDSNDDTLVKPLVKLSSKFCCCKNRWIYITSAAKYSERSR